MKTKAIVNWSSGKDSALALYKILQEQQYEVMGLLTTINSTQQRISMHGVRSELLEKQAKSIGIPLYTIEMPEIPSMETYEELMRRTLDPFQQMGVTSSIFGDIFLEDLRAYREEKLASMGFEGIFPLWKMDTKTIIKEFLALGFKTIVTCVHDRYLDQKFVGRIIDEQFISDLPDEVDICGENGEFHTFTFDGPIFKEPIRFEIGEIVYRTYEKPKPLNNDNTGSETCQSEPNYGFWYCDLIPKP